LGSPHVPSTCAKSTAESPIQHNSNKKIEEVVTAPKSPLKLYQHPKRDSGTTNESSQRTTIIAQEVVRNSCGPPLKNDGNLQNHVEAHRREIKPVIEPDVKQVASPNSIDGSFAKLAEVPTIPVPTELYTSSSTSRQKVKVAAFYGLDRFFLSPSDVSSHEVSNFSSFALNSFYSKLYFLFKAELKSLHQSYASLSANELVEDSPKVGLPCVVRSEDNRKFYRSLITAILDKRRAKILFVDYGTEQETSLTDIKRMLPKYMKPPRLVSSTKNCILCFDSFL